MAAVAVAAEVSVMNIVASMTINTAPGPVGGFLLWCVMAAMAMKFGMGMTEFEIGFVMVEFPNQPIIGVVA